MEANTASTKLRSLRLCTAYATQLVAVLLFLGACSERTSANRGTSVEILAPLSTPLLVGPGGGQARQYIARAVDRAGDVLSGRTVTWAVSTPAIITVTQYGLVTAIAPGLGTVVATIDGKRGSLGVTVRHVPVAALAIIEDTLQLEVSALGAASTPLTLELADSTGAALSGPTIEFTSAAPNVASVATDGHVTAVSGGSTVVRAHADGQSDSAVVVVTEFVGLPTGFDIAIVDAQWTQGSQNEAGTIPMLRNGRAAVVNVRTRAPAAVPGANVFGLRVTNIAGTVVHAETKASAIPAGTSTTASPTLQFLVPASAIQPGMRWQIGRDPFGALPDTDVTTDIFPATPEELAVITPPLLRLRFVPVALAAHGNVTPNITASLIGQYIAAVRKLIPHGEIETSIGPRFVTSAQFGSPPQGGGPTFWTVLLAELDQQRVGDPGNVSAHWIGVVRPPNGFTLVTHGGWGYVPSSGSYVGPGSRTFTMVDYDWATSKEWVQQTLVHELGHNLGRYHVPGCGAGGVDPAYPLPDGSIGGGAHDTFAWEQGLSAEAPPVPSTHFDVMGYCRPVWISPYTYEAMVQFRGDVGTALVASPTPERVLFVRGHVEGAAVRIDTALVMNAVATPDNPSGSWVLQGYAEDGRLLFTHRFVLARYAHSETLLPFGVTVPLTYGDPDMLATIRVTGPTARADRRVR